MPFDLMPPPKPAHERRAAAEAAAIDNLVAVNAGLRAWLADRAATHRELASTADPVGKERMERAAALCDRASRELASNAATMDLLACLLRGARLAPGDAMAAELPA